MAPQHPRLLAVALIALLAACSTSSETTADPTDTPAETVAAAPEPVPAPARQDPQPPQNPQGPLTLDQQRRQALVAKYVEVGERLRADDKLDAALHELLKAKELAPTDQKVLELIAAVQAARGVPVGGVIDFHTEQVEQQRIAEERSRALVTEKLQRSREAMAGNDFRKAVDELRHARLIVQT